MKQSSLPETEMPMFLGPEFDNVELPLPRRISYGSRKEWAAHCADNPAKTIDTISTPDDVATSAPSARSKS
jgi:hypothetical protein